LKALLVAAVCVMFGCASSKPREEPEPPGALVVRVELGSPAPGVGSEVQVSNGAAVIATAKTNSCGTLILDPLPDGLYTVTARDKGKVKSVEQVKVQAGRDTDIRIDLGQPAPQPAAGGAQARSCTPPEILSGPNPQLTAEALEHRVQGCLLLNCRIGADGKVKGCTAVEPLEHLTESVLATMKKRIYKPSLCDGVPTETDYPVRISIRVRY
jgi:hypothetical protein